jgi:hypothetical protein
MTGMYPLFSLPGMGVGVTVAVCDGVGVAGGGVIVPGGGVAVGEGTVGVGSFEFASRTAK